MIRLGRVVVGEELRRHAGSQPDTVLGNEELKARRVHRTGCDDKDDWLAVALPDALGGLAINGQMNTMSPSWP